MLYARTKVQIKNGIKNFFIWFSTIFLFLSNKSVNFIGIICYQSIQSVWFFEFQPNITPKISNITPTIITENRIFATEKFNMRCETLIIIFYLYKKIKHWSSIVILRFQCFFYTLNWNILSCKVDISSCNVVRFLTFQYKSTVCFIVYFHNWYRILPIDCRHRLFFLIT